MSKVAKGFQVSKLAVPKLHEANINKMFYSLHSPRSPRSRLPRFAMSKSRGIPAEKSPLGRRVPL